MFHPRESVAENRSGLSNFVSDLMKSSLYQLVGSVWADFGMRSAARKAIPVIKFACRDLPINESKPQTGRTDSETVTFSLNAVPVSPVITRKIGSEKIKKSAVSHLRCRGCLVIQPRSGVYRITLRYK